MCREFTHCLVSTDWLQARLTAPNLMILDASYFLPNQNRNARAEYAQAHIPGAGFFDIDEIADRSSSLPHMLPSPECFASAAGALGISNDTHVIAYDNNSFMASARLWWTFRIFGHRHVSVLDGGMARWRAESRPVSNEASKPAPMTFHATFRGELVKSLTEVLELSGTGSAQILDARSAGRFAGTEPEPRAGLRSGHIPGSHNLFFKELIAPDSGCMKTPEILGPLFQAAGIDVHTDVVTTCGTGVTASVLALGLYLLGNENAAVYDGSWTEWGSRADTPVVTS